MKKRFTEEQIIGILKEAKLSLKLAHLFSIANYAVNTATGLQTMVSTSCKPDEQAYT